MLLTSIRPEVQIEFNEYDYETHYLLKTCRCMLLYTDPDGGEDTGEVPSGG